MLEKIKYCSPDDLRVKTCHLANIEHASLLLVEEGFIMPARADQMGRYSFALIESPGKL